MSLKEQREKEKLYKLQKKAQRLGKITPAEEFFYKASEYEEQGQYIKALELYNKAIQLNLEYAVAYNNRGLIHLKQNNYAQAIVDFNKAIQLKPHDAITYYNLGLVYHEQKNYSQALIYYNKAIKISPYHSKIYNNRGNIYMEKKDHKNSLSDYNKAIQLDQDNAEAYRNRGVLYSIQKQYDLAISDLSQAIRIRPDFPDFYNNLGLAYIEQKNYSQALYNFNKAIEFNPEYSDAYNNRGLTYAEQGYYAEALNDFNKALELEPTHSQVYNNRGNVYVAQKSYAQAISDFDKAIEIKFDYSRAYYNRGNCYLNQEEYEKALNDYNRCVELEPDYSNVYYAIGNLILIHTKERSLEQALIDFTNALANFDKSIELESNRKLIKETAFLAHSISLFIDNFEKARQYIRIAFENSDIQEQQHSHAYFGNIDRAEELYNKNKELQEANAELLEAKKRLQKLVSSYNHTIGNTIFPHTLYEVAERLKQQMEFRPDALILLDCYRAEVFMRHQSELLQLKHAAQDAQAFRDKILLSRLSTNTDKEASTMRGILNQALERVIARFLNEHYAKLEFQRNMILNKIGKTLKQLRYEFEDQVFFNKHPPFEWASNNLFPISIMEFSPAWEEIRLIPQSAAEAVLFGYFAELFYNYFKYSDYQSLTLHCVETEIEHRGYLLSVWENTYSDNATPASSGNGLSGIQEDLKMLNETDSEHETIETEDDPVNKLFRTKVYLRKNLFLSLAFEEHWG
jgi:tetratricopeptide (TPR) repeat protein